MIIVKKTVCVVFGGASSEYEISLMSSSSILRNLDTEKFDILTLGITKDGRWLLYSGGIDAIEDGTWVEHPENRTAFLSPDRSTAGLVVLEPDGTCSIRKIDVVFPVLHGKNGEDGTIQGLFQLSGIPYVGCGTLASALCMDKAITHSLLASANIEQAHYLWFYTDRYAENSEKILTKIGARLNFPVFVKPANAGSSVGITKVSSPEGLNAAIRLAAQHDVKIVVEEGIVGQEVECAVLGNRGKSEASIVGEIGAAAEFYDYDDKYKNGVAQLYIPARLDPEVAEEIRRTAVRAYNLLGCDGLARVDFFVTEKDKKVILNEINTLPGFTSISMYPKLWDACGLPYGALLEKLILCALEKNGAQ